MNKIDKLKLTWYSSYKINKIREFIRSLILPSKNTKIIFILGCQRSGTTIIQKLIGMNPDVKFYGEGDPPYFNDAESEKHHRIKSSNDVTQSLLQEPLKYIVIKPLYESHNANALITSHQNSKGIWVFRNYIDVIDSHLHYYNYNVRDYISPLFNKSGICWLNENISDEILSFINKFNINDMSDADLYGIFWIVRNSCYLNTKENENIILVNYEKLITSPLNQISRFCDFVNLPYYNFYSKTIRSNAMSKKVNFKLLQEIEEKCREIYESLLKLS